MFKQRRPASSKNGSLIITVDDSQSGRNLPGSNVTSWTKLVLDLYPPGTSTRYERIFELTGCLKDLFVMHS